MELICPKCHGTMRTYERNGVHVDQCADCRGIFLDRGELERLVDAETTWHEGGRPPQASSPGGSGHAAGGHGTSSAAPGSAGGLGAIVGEVLGQVQGRKHSSYGHGGKRKQSFLGELFG
ncbi:TFIIB-type zinc ribbon-containing protein [Geodermatophilus sp. SYSU D00079]